jgi:Pyridoxamine 5'-phosphate oxidase
MLAHTTPAGGVVLSPVTNFALQDRGAGTVAVNSSVAMWRKLERMRSNPKVALAFHARDHGFSNRPEYVLVQGNAAISSDDWHDAMGANWERFGGQPVDAGRMWNWWLRAYHDRVNVVIAVERVVVWPDLGCHGTPEVHGAALPAVAPDPQRPPGRGKGPRIAHARAARRAAKLPHALAGWVGADGFPVVIPVEVHGSVPNGMVLEAATGIVPAGGRRAGLTAHSFSRHVIGQVQHRYTGWLESNGGRIIYAPHTKAGYRIPRSRFAFNFAAGYGTRRGLRQARRAGIAVGAR